MKVATNRPPTGSNMTITKKNRNKSSLISTQKNNMAKLEEVDFHNLDNGTEEFTKLRKQLEGMNRKLSLTSAVLAEGNHVRADEKVFEEINQNNDMQEEEAPLNIEDSQTDNGNARISTDDEDQRVHNILTALNDEDNQILQKFMLRSIIYHTKRKIMEYNSIRQKQTQDDHG